MVQQNSFLERMRIATPCHVGWERMSGDERTRFCSQCSLHVYNISEMTEAEVRSLISRSEGRICARLHRRADGTVLTKDCPVGLRALRRRVSKTAGAALTALLSLCSVAAAQTKSQTGKSCSQIRVMELKRIGTQGEQGAFKGVVTDRNGAVIPGVEVKLTNELTKESIAMLSTGDGEFGFFHLSPGKYTFEVKASSGFKPYKETHLVIRSGVELRAEVALATGETVITVGVVSVDSLDKIETDNGTTVISGEMMRRIPHR